MSRKKIGLALGSGGARGLAHIGVIKVLRQNDIPIDFIAGSSVGSLIGGLFSTYENIEKVERIGKEFNWGDWINTFLDPTLGLGFIKGEKVETQLRNLVGETKIEDLKIPFRALATDLNTGESIVMDKGDLVKAIRASSSVPILFPPEKIDNRYLVDGGMSNPVPVETVREMGADIVIAVNLDAVYFLNERKSTTNSPSVMSILRNSVFLLRHHLADKEVRGADIVIEPDIPYIMDLDFVGKESIISGGEEAASHQIEKIKNLLLDK